jgi:periplasmic divalent cation tolerance protein
MAWVQVQTAAGSEEDAHRLGDIVLRDRLAACVQVIGPVHSRYWWQGELQSATEWLCLAKTTEDRADEVVASLRAAHSYDTPEVIVVAIVGGDEAYLGWVSDAVRSQ